MPKVRHRGRAHFSVMSIVVTLGAVVGAVVEVVHAAELHAARIPVQYTAAASALKAAATARWTRPAPASVGRSPSSGC